MKKVVLITGGSRGIGAECVRAFAAAGYNICFSYLNSEKAAQELVAWCNTTHGAVVKAVKADSRNPNDISRLVTSCVHEFGRIDALVNNAGVAESKLLVDMNNEDVYNVINANLNSCIFTTREVVRYMISNGEGKIVNIASMWGVSGSAMESVYSASKAGIIGFTKAMAKELGLMNINVNAVAPGCINTDMMKSYNEQDIKELEECAALGRIGKPEEIANVVLFLCSDGASFITGQCLSVDGGFLQ